MAKQTLPAAVIIASYNTKNLLRDLLQSLTQANFLPAEIIIVDNASQDGSQKMTTTDLTIDLPADQLQIKLIKNKTNLGFAAANNQGAAIASNPYLWLLNSDTLAGRNTLKELVDFMASHPAIGAVSPTIVDSRGVKQSVGGYFPSFLNILFFLFPLHRFLPMSWRKKIKAIYFPAQARPEQAAFDYLCGAALFIKKKAWDQTGGLSPDYFMYFEDNDFGWKLKKAGWQIAEVSTEPITHLEGASSDKSAVKKFKLSLESLIIFVKKNYSPARKFFLLAEIHLLGKISLFMRLLGQKIL